MHGLVGENGAGKSTVVGLVAGSINPDEGWLELGGVKDPYSNPSAAHAAGIAVVFQEFQTLPGISGSRERPLGSKWTRNGIVSWRRANQLAREAIAEVALDIDVRRPMEDLDPAHRKLVEIARAVHLGARVVLLDEPTAALEKEDSEHVLAAVRRLREAGCAVVFVSHRLQEVLQLCDRITVLRDGRKVGSWPAQELTAGKARRPDGRPRAQGVRPRSFAPGRRTSCCASMDSSRRGCETSASRSIAARSWGWPA